MRLLVERVRAAGYVRACLRRYFFGLVAPGLIQINLAAGITSRVSLYIETTLVIHNFYLRPMPL